MDGSLINRDQTGYVDAQLLSKATKVNDSRNKGLLAGLLSWWNKTSLLWFLRHPSSSCNGLRNDALYVSLIVCLFCLIYHKTSISIIENDVITGVNFFRECEPGCVNGVRRCNTWCPLCGTLIPNGHRIALVTSKRRHSGNLR